MSDIEPNERVRPTVDHGTIPYRVPGTVGASADRRHSVTRPLGLTRAGRCDGLVEPTPRHFAASRPP